MKTKESTHPLAIWLHERGMSPIDFARDNGIGVATLYSMMEGRPPRLKTLWRVEEGTGGEVPLRAIVDWHVNKGEDLPNV